MATPATLRDKGMPPPTDREQGAPWQPDKQDPKGQSLPGGQLHKNLVEVCATAQCTQKKIQVGRRSKELRVMGWGAAIIRKRAGSGVRKRTGRDRQEEEG